MDEMGEIQPALGVRVALILLGWAFVAGAISVLIKLDLGVAPYDVLNTAIGERLNISVGTGMWITGTILVGVSWVLGVRPGVGTILGFFAIGIIINYLLDVLPELDSMVARGVLLGPSLVALYMGVCFIILSKVGAGPTEILMMALHKKGLSLSVSRWGIEAACAAVGGLLGGSLGVLTIIIVVVAGPTISYLLPRTSKALTWIVG